MFLPLAFAPSTAPSVGRSNVQARKGEKVRVGGHDGAAPPNRNFCAPLRSFYRPTEGAVEVQLRQPHHLTLAIEAIYDR